MKFNIEKLVYIIIFIVFLAIISIFIFTGNKTSVILKDYEIFDNKITLKVETSDSSGYLRKMKVKEDDGKYYLTFYKTFGINNKLNSKDTFELELKEDINEIYFYGYNKEFNCILTKNKETNTWEYNEQENISDNINTDSNLDINANNVSLKIVESKNCDNKRKLYYEENGVKIYTYCLDKVTLNDVDLKKYFEATNVNALDTMALVLNKFKEQDKNYVSYRDGGSMKFTYNGQSILLCHTEKNNNDIYIGTDKMQLNRGRYANNN